MSVAEALWWGGAFVIASAPFLLCLMASAVSNRASDWVDRRMWIPATSLIHAVGAALGCVVSFLVQLRCP